MTNFMHGGDLDSHPGVKLDFSANISPLGLPESVKAALAASMDGWDRYPDPFCRALTAAIAAHHGVPAGWVLCGNGAADLIYRLAQALRPRGALVAAPTFTEYARACESAGAVVSRHRLYEKDGFALTGTILRRLDGSVNLLALCNPNNPTGRTIEPELLTRVLRACADKGITLLLDECFAPLLEEPESRIPDLGRYGNLVILRAFTKLYGMAGLRLGYLLCSDGALLERVRGCGQPWGVSAPAQAAGVAALADAGYVEAVRALLARERPYLRGALGSLGLTVIGSQANFLFFKCYNRRDLRERLLERGILIRSCENFEELDGRFYRVAVKTREENERLVSALGEALKKEG